MSSRDAAEKQSRIFEAKMLADIVRAFGLPPSMFVDLNTEQSAAPKDGGQVIDGTWYETPAAPAEQPLLLPAPEATDGEV